MKNFMVFGIVCLSLIFQSGVRAEFASQEEFEKVNFAIKASDLLVVENFLKNYTLKKQEQNDLLEKATTTLTEKEQRVELLKSPWDNVAALASATLLMAVGILMADYVAYCNGIAPLYTVKSIQISFQNLFIKQDIKKMSYGLIAATLFLPCQLGVGFLGIKKWKRVTVLNRYENAKKIKGLIEAAKVA